VKIARRNRRVRTVRPEANNSERAPGNPAARLAWRRISSLLPGATRRATVRRTSRARREKTKAWNERLDPLNGVYCRFPEERARSDAQASTGAGAQRERPERASACRGCFGTSRSTGDKYAGEFELRRKAFYFRSDPRSGSLQPVPSSVLVVVEYQSSRLAEAFMVFGHVSIFRPTTYRPNSDLSCRKSASNCSRICDV
jgi:hypothetical protein